jgi:MGT family glycosyltransferase
MTLARRCLERVAYWRNKHRRWAFLLLVISVVRSVSSFAFWLSATTPYLEIQLSHILVCAVPNPGHVGPMLAIAQHLKSVGHNITFNTSENFRNQVESADVRFVAMTGKANYDYRRANELYENKSLSAEDQKLHLLISWFSETIPDQHQGIQRILRETLTDLVLVDTMLLGSFPMLLGPRQKRPLVIGCGVNPMMLISRDCGFTLPPSNTPEGRQRILEENQRIQAQFQPLTDHISSIMRTYGIPALPHFFTDCMYLLPDLFLQFTAEALEFPRGDMPDTVHFVGPVLPKRSVEFEEPTWWAELDGSKPVVLVTQGTLTNHDFNEVIQPALSGLSDEEVMVIVAAGRSDTQTLAVPANARVASFVPFDRILPKVDVLVTNGGYGAVNHAFSLGVPIVVAGETEEKDFIAARVGWTGAGINLKTRYASAEQIRNAVRAILTNKRYREEAKRLQMNFARHNTLDELARTVDAMLTQD